MRRWLFLLVLLVAGCANEKAHPPSEEAAAVTTLRYQAATVPEDGGWAKLPGEVLEGFHPRQVSAGQLFLFRQFDKIMLKDGDSAPVVLAEKSAGLKLLDRLDRDHLLVAGDTLGVLEFSTGKLAKLPQSRSSLVSLDGNRLYFWADGQLSDQNGPLSQRRFDRLLDEDRQAFYALAGGEVYRVEKAGGEKLVGKCPVPPGALTELSPDRKRMALGLGEGRLQVYELATGKLLRELSGIDVAVSRMSLRPQQVHVGWLNDDTLRYSSSEHTADRDPEFYNDRSREQPEGYFRWHDLDLRTGQDHDRGRYSKMGLQHHAPTAEVLRAEHVFQLDEMRLWLPKSRLAFTVISADGQWAVVLERTRARQARLLLLDGAGHSTQLAEGRGIYGALWLPPVGPSDWNPCGEMGTSRSAVFRDRCLRFFERTWQTGEESPAL